MEQTTLFDVVMRLFKQKKFSELKTIMGQMNPADVANIIESADGRDVIALFRLLPKELATEAFAYIDSDQQEQLILAFTDRELREVIDELFLDDTVDLIEEMPANIVNRILKNTDEHTRKQINELLAYPDDSAGTLMTTEYVYFHKDMTVAQCITKLRQVGLSKETVDTCYVTEQRKLIGIVKIFTLINAPDDAVVCDIMETNPISVGTKEDKETVATMVRKYDLTTIPVVDGEGRLVGIVTVDDILDVVQDENTEDIEKMAAIVPTDKPYFKTGVLETFLKRIPWLLLLMVSATFTGMIITGFEDKLAASVVLTAFIPMLMDTGGNAGGQASVTIIRGLSLGDIGLKDVCKVVWKEIRVAVICGVVLSAVNFGKMMLVDRLLLGNAAISASVALVVCVTMAVSVLIAKIIGCSLPILAKAIGFDPAVMASPFITTIVDAVTLLAYFMIAQGVLHI